MHAAPSDKFVILNSHPCIDTIHTNFHPVKTLWQNQYSQVTETNFLSIFYSLSFLPVHETRLLNTDTRGAFWWTRKSQDQFGRATTTITFESEG
jgi:hypothetical protein